MPFRGDMKLKKNSKIMNVYKRMLSLVLALILPAAFLLSSVKADAKETLEEKLVTTKGQVKINLLVLVIDPLLTSVDDSTFANGEKSITASDYFGYSYEDSVYELISTIEEASHNTVQFNWDDTVELGEFPHYVNMDPLDNESFQEIFPKDENGRGNRAEGIRSDKYRPYNNYGNLDYEYYVKRCQLDSLRRDGAFDMVLIIGVDPLSPSPTCIIGRNPFWVNGMGVRAECDNFPVLTVTFSEFDAALENFGNMAEMMLSLRYDVLPTEENSIDGSNYTELNDWEKYTLCKHNAKGNTEVYGYGLVNYAPNSEEFFDLTNPDPVQYYKNWKKGDLIDDFDPYSAYINNSVYSDEEPYVSHLKWWFSNMPYQNGRDDDGYFTNWWRYIFSADYLVGMSQSSIYNKKIQVRVGETIPVKFELEYFGAGYIETDTEYCLPAVSLSNEECMSYSDGRLKGLRDGSGYMDIKVDGKKITYFVEVGEGDGEKPSFDYQKGVGVSTSDTPDFVKSKNPFGNIFKQEIPMGVFISVSAVVFILALAAMVGLVILLNRRN